MRKVKCDVLIMGASLGGVSAAVALAKEGKKVVLLSKHKWIGGQLTSQGVPADEHGYIDDFGSSFSYRQLRTDIRNYYRDNLNLKEEYRNDEKLNPGSGWVSMLCVSPRYTHEVILEMVANYSNIEVVYGTEVIDFITESSIIREAVTNDNRVFCAKVYIDSTELGDSLPLLDIPYIQGSESEDMTMEEDALKKYEPQNMQAVTWCFAVSLEPSGDYTIDKPFLYDHFRSKIAQTWKYSQIGWKYPNPRTLETMISSLDGREDTVDLFKYRQIYDPLKFVDGGSPITIVNWPQNDYWDGPIFGNDNIINNKHNFRAKEVSKSLLYWLQTEGGYPNLKLHPKTMGTDDGFAMEPYIRESRRILAKTTVTQSMITPTETLPYQSDCISDSVGIGYYHLDLHPTTGGSPYFDREALPFQIPLGCMIQEKYLNWLPGAKNVGSTHITNGCLRLHPVEWVIGESSGYLASYMIDNKLSCQAVNDSVYHIKRLQSKLIEAGMEIYWPNNGDVRDLPLLDK